MSVANKMLDFLETNMMIGVYYTIILAGTWLSDVPLEVQGLITAITTIFVVVLLFGQLKSARAPTSGGPRRRFRRR